MSAFSDLQKRLEQEAQGIMFPFAAKKPTVDTTQQVYNSATDGIMTMTGQKYVGPDSVVQYGSEKQGYPRQLKQIEAPMLPQFDAQQFPKAGEGIIKAPSSAPIPTPSVKTKPETPVVDPCPPGYRLVNGVCQLIQQQSKNDRPAIKVPKITNGIIEGYEGLSDMRRGPAFYNTLTDSEKLDYNKAISFGRGIQYKTLEDGTKKIIAKSPTFSQALAEMAPLALIVDAVKKLAEKVFGKEVFKKEEITKSRPTLPSTGLTKSFGQLDTGTITIEDLPPLIPDEKQTVTETGEVVTARRIPKIIQKLNNIKNGYLTETDSRIKEQKRIEYENALDNADTVFETSVKQSSGSELSPEQKQYIDSDNRKARVGESKNQDGSLDSRKGFVKDRENSGYGFRATSANSKKQKNGSVTFDQRFK